MKELQPTSEIMQLLEEQEVVPFLRIQTLFFQLMPFRDVGDLLAMDRDSSEVTVLSVVGLMKEAIAQHMVPSVTNDGGPNHFKQVCRSRNASSSSKQGGQSPYQKKGKQQ